MSPFGTRSKNGSRGGGRSLRFLWQLGREWTAADVCATCGAAVTIDTDGRGFVVALDDNGGHHVHPAGEPTPAEPTGDDTP